MAPPPLVASITTWDVRKAATSHRVMLMLLLASFPVTVPYFATIESSPTNLIVALVSLSLSIGMIVFPCKALSAMRSNIGPIILTAILLPAPCVNFFTLVVLSRVIQRRLKTVGLTCGFLGVSRSNRSAAGC